MKGSKQYTKLYDAVLDIPEASDTQKIILSKIMSFESNGMSARMGNKFFAKKLGLSDRQVRRHLQHLEKLLLIVRVHTPQGRILKVGPKCPTPWSINTSSPGQNRPNNAEGIDHLLDKVNRNF
ncbi:helix-turn-helix domain-containing protein [Owenweeksia hongkongensis]|uniref:helix-turn-helix domain-containing protein n=1 Tax=Owenweeksia hongkongensis TaxID=253245 RepID=UPI003A8F7065